LPAIFAGQCNAPAGRSTGADRARFRALAGYGAFREMMDENTTEITEKHRGQRTMRKKKRRGTGAINLLGLLGAGGVAQATPYPSGDLEKTYDRLLKEINKIPLYDNHAHPGFADDSDVDAMASPPDESATLRLRDDNPEFVAGAKALFGYPYGDLKPEHAKWLAEKKKAAEAAGGGAHFDHCLCKLKINTLLPHPAVMVP